MSEPTLRAFADDLQEERDRREKERASLQARRLLETIRRLPPPQGGPARGGMDLSAVSCDCVCHAVYGARRSRRSRKSSCEHCRVYG